MAEMRSEDQVVIGKPRLGRIAPIKHFGIIELRDDFGKKKVHVVMMVGEDVYLLPRDIFTRAPAEVAATVREFFVTGKQPEQA